MRVSIVVPVYNNPQDLRQCLAALKASAGPEDESLRKRLFVAFFKTYTKKVWGIPCAELKAEWVAQRIKDLSLKTALLNMSVKPQRTIKPLIEEFDYPRLGPA